MGIILEALHDLNNIQEEEKKLVEDVRGWFLNRYNNLFGDIPDKEKLKKFIDVLKVDPTFKINQGDTDEQILAKTRQGAYTEWLLNLIKKNRISYNDLMAEKQEYRDQLEIFNDLKNRNRLPVDKKDIMRFKSLSEIMNLLSSLGVDLSNNNESTDSFKYIIRNIRAALISVCGFRDEEIPPEIRNTEDCLTLIGENNKWEIWLINSIWGAMLADTFGIDWGAGATWCTGGQYSFVGEPRKGQELLNSAQRHYPDYTSRGRHLVFFSQKDNSVRRPQNKAQITFDNDFYSCDNFFHANDKPITISEDGHIFYSSNAYFHNVNTAEVFSVFINEEGLMDTIKGSILKNCESIKDAENKQRLENGEPYDYTGGKIKEIFKPSIRIINFIASDGKTHEIDVTEHPQYLECISVNEMENMENLINGEPYIYDGTSKEVPTKFRELVREVIIPDSYEQKVSWVWSTGEHGNYIGIPHYAFKGCVNMTKCTFPETVRVLASGCFRVNGHNAPYTDIELYTPRHKISCADGEDVEFYKHHLNYTS